MDIVKIQALIAEGKLVQLSDIDPDKTYVQVGVYQTGNQQKASPNANAYASYAMPVSELVIPPTPPDFSVFTNFVTAYVDGINGNDATAQIGNFLYPFLTPTAAVTALEALAPSAQAYRMLYFRPGYYTQNNLSLTTYVHPFNVYMEPGAIFNPGANQHTFNMIGGSLKVWGYGRWQNSNGLPAQGGVVRISGGSLEFECDSISIEGAGFAGSSPFFASDMSRVVVKANYARFATNGITAMNISADTISIDIGHGVNDIRTGQAFYNGGSYLKVGANSLSGVVSRANINFGTLEGGCELVSAYVALLEIFPGNNSAYSNTKVGNLLYLGGTGGAAFNIGNPDDISSGVHTMTIGALLLNADAGTCAVANSSTTTVDIARATCNVNAPVINISGTGTCVLKGEYTSFGAAPMITRIDPGTLILKARLSTLDPTGFCLQILTGSGAPTIVMEQAVFYTASSDSVKVFPAAPTNALVYSAFTNVAFDANVTQVVGTAVVNASVV